MNAAKAGQLINNQRIDYIDTLRGLCMLSIVWYHTDHPDFLNYPYYNATLFFVSGLLFKPTPLGTFFKKKFFTLLIPFVFFYLIYYGFLLATNYAKFHTISKEIVFSILDVFRLYSGTDGYTCNYPLWFIGALFWIQLMTNLMNQILKKPTIILIVALVIYILGVEYVDYVPTPFMIGRSFTFLIYYVVGYVFSTKFIGINNPSMYMIISLFAFCLLRYIGLNSSNAILDCLGFVAIAIALLMICKMIVNVPIMCLFTYFGIHSIIVFGMHDMYLTIFRIITVNLIGDMNLILGFANWGLTLLIMVPTIVFINKYIPYCVGKRRQ